MSTRFARTALALALSTLLLPGVYAAGEPAEGLKASSNSTTQQASQRNLVPVYFIGSHQDNLILQNGDLDVLHNALEYQDKMAVSHFDFKGRALQTEDAGTRLVFVDGAYVANLRQGTWDKVRAYMADAAQSGNPVIAFVNPRIGMNLFKEQEQDSLPVDTSTGETATAYGYYQAPQGYARAFFTNQKDVASVMKLARQWAKEVLDEQDEVRFFQKSVGRQEKYTAPAWNAIPNYQRSTLNWNESPYGTIDVKTAFIKLNSDGNSTYDWWQVHLQQIVHPSLIAFGNDTWRNADMWTVLTADAHISGFLSDYGPTTTANSSTVGVSLTDTISSTGGSVGISASWSYTLSDVQVNDQSIGNSARWWHDLNEGANVGWNTYNAQPGALVRVPNGTTAIYNRFYELYQGQWAHRSCGALGVICHWNLSGYKGLQWN